jgi:hypothetical protein
VIKECEKLHRRHVVDIPKDKILSNEKEIGRKGNFSKMDICFSSSLTISTRFSSFSPGSLHCGEDASRKLTKRWKRIKKGIFCPKNFRIASFDGFWEGKIMSRLDDIRHTEALTAKERECLEKALTPHRSMADFMKAIQPPSLVNGLSEIAEAMQPAAHLTALFQMLSAMRREHRLFDEFVRPPESLDGVRNQNAKMRVLSESITAPYHTVREKISSQSAVFEGLSGLVAASKVIELSIPLFSQAALTWNVASIGMANRMDEIGLLIQREGLSARLLEAPGAFAEFVRHTMEHLAADPAPEAAVRLRASLTLAEQQLLDMADTAIGFLGVPDDEEEPDAKRVLNAPFTQQKELLACQQAVDERETDALALVSCTAQTVQRGLRVLELVTQCNEAGKTSACGVKIFKPTTRMLTAFADLPWISSTDRSLFADLVDCLYVIFYEGAGRDKLRFLDKYGGPLTETDCDLIWCIKHLRKRFKQPDADHEKEKGNWNSWMDLASFRLLGLDVQPTEPRYSQLLHYKLLVSAENFLERLLSKFKRKQ